MKTNQNLSLSFPELAKLAIVLRDVENVSLDNLLDLISEIKTDAYKSGKQAQISELWETIRKKS